MNIFDLFRTNPESGFDTALEFGWVGHWSVALVIVLLVILAGYLYYMRKVGALSGARRMAVLSTRLLILLIAVTLALDPRIVQTLPKAGEQVVLLLFDDSQSMQVQDENEQPRGQRLLNEYQKNESELERQLQEQFVVARYRVGAGVQRMSSVSSLSFRQPRSDLGESLQAVQLEWAPDSVAAVVLMSDGIQNPPGDPVQSPVPVITVGIEEESQWSDLSIESIQVQRPRFDKSPVRLTASVASQGFAGAEATVTVFDGLRAVATQPITISSDRETIPVTLEWVPTMEDWIQYTVQVTIDKDASLLGEEIPEDRAPQNNTQSFVVDNRPITYRILYISGRPNWEHTFIRRALQEDERLRLTSLIQLSAAQRTFVFRGARTQTVNPLFEGFGEDEVEFGRYDEPIFLRIGAEEQELSDGFPTDPEDLYEYDLIILGDIEREFFRTSQMELLRSFVSERGGSFLMMGGPRSFVDGGYSGTPIEPLLPVILLEQNRYAIREYEPVQVVPTLEGELDGIFSLSMSQLQSEQTWMEMPFLYGLTPFSIVRPGASVLARTTDRESHPVYVQQRYGAGRSAILATGETWAWHMRADDESRQFGRVWRQVMRSLVENVEPPILIETPEEELPQFAPVTLRMNVRDKAFSPTMGAAISVEAIRPDGERVELPYDESIREPGLYTIPLVPEQQGLYRIQATVALDSDKSEMVEAGLWIDEDTREWDSLKADASWLQQTASNNGGSYMPLNELDQLPGRIPVSETVERERIQTPIMDWSGWFFILLILFSIEWILRRTRGLA